MTETLRYKYTVELVRRSPRINVQLSLIVRGYQFVSVFPLYPVRIILTWIFRQ